MAYQNLRHLQVIGVRDTWEMICERGVEKKILLTPGTAFNPGNHASSFIRLSFSQATEEQFDKVRRKWNWRNQIICIQVLNEISTLVE